MTRSHTITRRVRSITTVFLGLVASTVLFPLLMVTAVAYDFVRWMVWRTPWMAVRLVPLGWLYLFTELVGIAALFGVWLVSVGGRIQPILLAGTYAVQKWWTGVLFSSIRRLFRLNLEVEGADLVASGPLLVFMRHASIIDNLLPNVLITRPYGLRLKYVLKRELLSDPALDIAGNRLPNYFVDRASTDSAAETAAIGELARELRDDEGILIYPEGTRFTKDRQIRALARLEQSSPSLHARASAWTEVLPPRLGGPLALLDASDADVVIAAHAGLGGFSHIRNILAGGLVGSTIRVRFQRFAHDEIPEGRGERIAWLYDRWAEIDDWIAA